MNLHRLSILSFFVVAFFFSCEISVVGCVGKNLELPASSSQPLPGPRSLLDSVKSKITKWRNSTREHQTQRHRRDFFNACRAGKSTKVFQLLNGHHKVHIDQMNDDEKGWSCINYATVFNHPSLVLRLLDQGATFDHVDANGHSILQQLIGLSPLVGTLQTDMVSTLQILLDHAHAKLTKTQFFSFINYSGDVSSSLVNPPIILAIEYQNVAAVQLLLSESLPTDLYLGSISNMQRNPLMMAVVGANTEIAGLLLARGGFDLNQQDAKLNTALHFACKLPTSSMVQTLIAYDNDRKINPNIKNYKGKTPLMHCSDSSDSFQKTSAMIKHFQSRLKSTLVDGRGKSALMSAIEGQTYRPTPIAWQTIQLLLKLAYNSGEMDILPKQREKQGGNTVLHAACELDHFSAHLRIIKFILEYGADVDAQNNLGFTPLMIAISCTGRGYVNREIIQTLVNDYRASLEIRNNEGMTALQIAYEKGRLDVAQFLASHLPIKPLEVEEKECAICFSEFNRQNPRLKPYLCDHSLDLECYKNIETHSSHLPLGSKCPQCRSLKKLREIVVDLRPSSGPQRQRIVRSTVSSPHLRSLHRIIRQRNEEHFPFYEQ